MSEQELYIELGIVGIKNMGEYSSQTQYEKLNVVTYQGSSYCALKSSIGVLPTNTDYWQLYAEKGEKGDTGEQGSKPVKGEDYYTEEDKQELINELELTLDSDVTDEVTEQLGGLVSATPLVASSVSGMTDTSRIYVNSTDGHWYWYDGSSWIDGGVYQAAEDSETLMITNNATKGLGVSFCKNGLFPLKSLGFGYLNNTTGEPHSDYSRLYTNDYVNDYVQRILIDTGYAICVYCYDNNNSYVGRITTDYEVSNAGSGVSNKWFTDLDLNFIRGKFPDYKFKLVFRKDDYSSISNIAAFLSHFNCYVKNEAEKTIFKQNNNYEFNIDDIWSVGEIEAETGNILANNARLYTTDFLPEYVNKIKLQDPYVVKIHGYNQNDVYKGRLVNTGRFRLTGGTTSTPTEFNFDELRKMYPNYKFKLTLFILNNTNAKQITNSKNCLFISNRKEQDSIISTKHYGYSVTSLPNTANHDMTYVGDYIYIFDAPSSQYAGKFNILNSDLTLNKTKYTNFNYLLRDGETRSYLRMKSIDFNPLNNVLLAANGQAPVLIGDSYLFLFYDSSNWKNSGEQVIDFTNCGEYKKIDLSDLGDRVYCFWKSYENTSEIYVTTDNLEKIYLIELGKGNTNLGWGIYEQTSNDKYNGSYRVINCYKQLNSNIPKINAHGGQAYKGELYLASNNEYECVIYKAVFKDDGSLYFEKIDLNSYENGTLKYSYIDGLLIKDDIIIADPLHVDETYNTGTNKVLLKIKL